MAGGCLRSDLFGGGGGGDFEDGVVVGELVGHRDCRSGKTGLCEERGKSDGSECRGGMSKEGTPTSNSLVRANTVRPVVLCCSTNKNRTV
jgi:hypothetical protein